MSLHQPKSLLDTTADFIITKTLYRCQEFEYLRNALPKHLMQYLIRKLFLSDKHTIKNFTLRDAGISRDSIDWFNLTLEQFITLMYYDRHSLIYDEYWDCHEVTWQESDRKCRDCCNRINKEAELYYIRHKIKKHYGLVSSVINVKTYQEEDVNFIIHNVNNWCVNCLVKPLFSITISCNKKKLYINQ